MYKLLIVLCPARKSFTYKDCTCEVCDIYTEMYFNNSLLQKKISFFLHTYVTVIQTRETTLADKRKLEEYELLTYVF